MINQTKIDQYRELHVHKVEKNCYNQKHNIKIMSNSLIMILSVIKHISEQPRKGEKAVYDNSA